MLILREVKIGSKVKLVGNLNPFSKGKKSVVVTLEKVSEGQVLVTQATHNGKSYSNLLLTVHEYGKSWHFEAIRN